MTLDQAIVEVQQICGWRSDKATQIQNAIAYAQREREKPNRTYPWFLRTTNDTAIVTSYGVMGYPIPSDYIEDSEEIDGNLYIYLLSSPATVVTTGLILTGPDGAILASIPDASILIASPFTTTAAPGTPNSRTVFLKKMNFKTAQERYFGVWPYVYANTTGFVYDTSGTLPPGVPRDYYLGDTFVNLYPPPDGTYNISWRYWGQDATPALGSENKWLKNAPWVLIGDAAAKISADLGYAAGVQTAVSISQSASDNLFRATINRNEAGKRRALGSRL